MSTPPSAYLELEAVEAWLGPRRVFEDLSLRLHRGENTVVLGPNGSGKSSLVKLLSREIYPVVKSGSCLRIFGSETVNLWALRGRIGLVSRTCRPPTSAGCLPPMCCSPFSSARWASAAARWLPPPSTGAWRR